MPLNARNIAMILLSAFVFGMGIGAVTAPQPDPAPSAAERRGSATETPDVQALDRQPPGDPAMSPSASPSGTVTPGPSIPPTTAPPGPGGLTAAAGKQTAAAYESVAIRGQLSPAQSGVTLVVQRLKDGRWSDFPAQTTTSSNGSYQVTVSSGQAGENAYRVVWRERNVISNEVRITTA
jgi:hypothetical protein